MCNGRTQPVTVLDRVSFSFQPLSDQPHEHILFGESLRSDKDAVALASAKLCEKRRDNAQRDHYQATKRQAAFAARHPALDQAQQSVCNQRQACGRKTAGEHQHPVLRLQSGEDRITQARLTDRSRECRRTNCPYARRTNTRHDEWCGKRRFDQPQFLPACHSHAIGSFEHAGVKIGLSRHSISQDRQQRVKRQCQQCRQEAERWQAFAKDDA